MAPFETLNDVKALFAYTTISEQPVTLRISADQNQIEMLTGKSFNNSLFLETDKLLFSREGLDITVIEKKFSNTYHSFYHDRMRVLIDREDNTDEYDDARWEMVSKMYYGDQFSGVEMF